MREFVKLPRTVWSMVGFTIGWLIPVGIMRLVEGDAPRPVAVALLLSGIALALIAFIHRAQWRSSERFADKRREDEERRRQAQVYEKEIEARKREYEAFRRRNSPEP
ncbi:hypothetical protein [Arthrobacter citreus]|uniref:hypothetical protein n=1 Tax=Arthrobacter citreus TaxID=1670 RepID=UPI0036DAD6D5